MEKKAKIQAYVQFSGSKNSPADLTITWAVISMKQQVSLIRTSQLHWRIVGSIVLLCEIVNKTCFPKQDRYHTNVWPLQEQRYRCSPTCVKSTSDGYNTSGLVIKISMGKMNRTFTSRTTLLSSICKLREQTQSMTSLVAKALQHVTKHK